MSRTGPMRFSLAVCVSIAAASSASMMLAAPASPEPLLLEQADGTLFPARLRGDEWQNGTETLDGYTILLDSSSGNWVYAEMSPTGDLIPSGAVVGRDAPAPVPRSLRPGVSGRRRARMGSPRHFPASAQPAPPAPGIHRLLVIVADFTPSSSRGVTQIELSQHFFTGGGTYTPTSVKDYWETVSYGAITVTPAAETYGTPDDGIVFVTLGYENPLCGTSIGSCHRTLSKDAIEAADPYVDYSLFDDNIDGYLNTDELHIYIVVRGLEGSFGGTSCGTPSTWAHRWSFDYSPPTLDGIVVGHTRGAPSTGPYQGGYMQEGEWHEWCPGHSPGHKSTIGGAAVHELGHDLGTGMPDLYDARPTVGTDAEGIGEWGVMGTGAWTTTYAAGGHSGQVPAWPEAYSRWWFGFLTPMGISTTTLGASLPQIETAIGADRGVYVIPDGSYTHWDDCSGGTGEYWLVENRQKVGFDAGLPGDGLLIWHIFEELSSCRPNGNEGTAPPGYARLVVLEQADGLFGLECYGGGQCNRGDSGDPWKVGTATTFDDTTTPGSRYYSGEASNISVANISSSGAGMTADVVIVVCGDLSVDPPEECDDGNLSDGDGCDSNCTWTACGNGIVTAGEECDDGNTDDNDGCSSTCTIEPPCLNPIPIPAEGGVLLGVTAGTSAMTGTCGDSGSAPEVAFEWTPDASGTAVIQTCGETTDFDTVVYMRSGSCEAGPEAECSNDGCTLQSRITPAVTAGQTYYIIVDGNSGAGGAFALSVSMLSPLCAPSPQPGCRTAAKSVFLLKDTGRKKKLVWKWIKGDAPVAEFGDPTTTTSYALCVYDESSSLPSLVTSAPLGVVPPGGLCGGKACWKQVGGSTLKGFKYKDKTLSRDGMSVILLKGDNPGKDKLLVKGKGGTLPIPAPVSLTELFEQDTTVTVQLVQDNGPECWEAAYTGQNTKKNEPSQFKAKVP